MKRSQFLSPMALAVLCAAVLATTGCGRWRTAKEQVNFPGPPHVLGSVVDQVFQMQEERAEASEFVVYDHEFKLYTARLNDYGREHVKQIAVRLQAGQCFPVIIERTEQSVRENTQFKFPIHYNPDLDLLRREVIVKALEGFGISDAEDRVSVAPAFAEGFKATEAQQAYQAGSFGSFFGGGGGFGGFGFGFGG